MSRQNVCLQESTYIKEIVHPKKTFCHDLLSYILLRSFQNMYDFLHIQTAVVPIAFYEVTQNQCKRMATDLIS